MTTEPLSTERLDELAFAFGDPVWPGLAKLNEECGEVIQVIGKLMMTHGAPAHWSGDLRAMLVDEIADVIAAALFVRRFALTAAESSYIEGRVIEKRMKFEAWHADMDADPPPPLRARAKEANDGNE
jgi:hypothetical protein